VAPTPPWTGYLRALVRPGTVAGASVFAFRRYRSRLGDLIDRISREPLPAEVQAGLEPAQGSSVTDEEAEALIHQSAPELVSTVIESLHAELAAEPGQSDAVIQRLLRQLAIAEIRADFESIYARIYGSQIAALKSLRATPDGASRASVEAHLAEVKDNVNMRLLAWLQSLPFEEWFGYLQQHGLAEVDADERYQITTVGAGFLAYIEGRGYAPKSF
jgi:hypothetical protein